MFNIQQFLFRLRAWARFYLWASTKYQVHSPFVFQWITDVLEDKRNYYAFGAIAALRNKMRANHTKIEVTDFGAGPGGSLEHSAHSGAKRATTIAQVTARSASDTAQGTMLFKLAQMHQPYHLLELGSSVGLGTLYLAQGTSSKAHFVSLEGCPVLAGIARLNLETLGSGHVKVISGAFEANLASVVAAFPQLDLVYFDGNHQEEPTLTYFNACLPKVHDGTVFIFDDVHWSAGMEKAWNTIRQHPKVTLTIDCGHFACAYFNSVHQIKQDFRVVPSSWKPWKVF